MTSCASPPNSPRPATATIFSPSTAMSSCSRVRSGGGQPCCRPELPGSRRPWADRLEAMADKPDVTTAVVAQWRSAASAMAEIRRENLRQLTDEDAVKAAEELLDPCPPPASTARHIRPGRAAAHLWRARG